MRLQIEQLLQSPNLRLLVNEAEETLRGEEQARQRFRDSLSEDVRAEFINGEVVLQVPARDRHTVAVKNIAKLLDTYVVSRKLGAVRTEQALTAFSRNDYAPDICFWGRSKSRFTADQLIYPVPDLICEVLSRSTAAVDRGIKFQDYEAHGVGEYWIIDPNTDAIDQFVLKDEQFDLVGRFERGSIRSRIVRSFNMPVRDVFDDAENLTYLKKLLKS